MPPAEPAKFRRSECTAFLWGSGFKPQQGINPPPSPAAAGPFLSPHGRGAAALPARCGRRGALCAAAAPSGPRAGTAGAPGEGGWSPAGLGLRVRLATAKPAPHLAARPHGSPPFAVISCSTICLTRCFSSLNTWWWKLATRSVCSGNWEVFISADPQNLFKNLFRDQGALLVDWSSWKNNLNSLNSSVSSAGLQGVPSRETWMSLHLRAAAKENGW